MAAVTSCENTLLCRTLKKNQGTGHYLSPWGRIMGGGSVVTENPKGGITENFGRIRRGDHSHLLGK